MPFDLGAVLRSAAVRTLKTSGLLFVATMFALGTVNTTIASSIAVPTGGSIATPGYQLPFEVPLSVAGAVTIVVGLLTLYVTMVAIRTFARKETDSIPSVAFTRNALPAYANFVVGGFVFATVVFVGLLLFLLPGLFVFATLGFWAVYVAVEDEDFVTGLQDSWVLTDGHRLELLALVLSLIIISVGVNAVFGVADVAVGGAVGLLVSQVGTALSSVFSLATLTEAYVQLSALQSAAATASSL